MKAIRISSCAAAAALAAALSGCAGQQGAVVPSGSGAGEDEVPSFNISDDLPDAALPEGYVPGSVAPGSPPVYRNGTVGIELELESGLEEGAGEPAPGRECAAAGDGKSLAVDYMGESGTLPAAERLESLHRSISAAAGDLGYADVRLVPAPDGSPLAGIVCYGGRDGGYRAVAYAEGGGHVVELSATAPDAQSATALLVPARRI